MDETPGGCTNKPHDRQQACQRGVTRVGPATDTCDDSTQRAARQGVSSQDPPSAGTSPAVHRRIGRQQQYDVAVRRPGASSRRTSTNGGLVADPGHRPVRRVPEAPVGCGQPRRSRQPWSQRSMNPSRPAARGSAARCRDPRPRRAPRALVLRPVRAMLSHRITSPLMPRCRMPGAGRVSCGGRYPARATHSRLGSERPGPARP